MSDLLKRRETHFVLWCPKPTNPPALIIGRIINGNPPQFDNESREPISFELVAGFNSLWQVDPAACGLTDGLVYHYWFEVENAESDTGRMQVTDPLAYSIDYRLLAPANPVLQCPASVIQFSGGKLVACDPNGEKGQPQLAPFELLASNNKMVIYELPTAWVRTSGFNEFERAVGTFRDVRALVDNMVSAANFPTLDATTNNRHLVQLGINALQILPPADSIYSREWGYGTSHYLAPDYELGYPEGHLSPTPNQDLVALVNACHERGIRIILDVVMGFAKDEPYRQIDLDSFYLEDPTKHRDDPDAYNSRNGGQVELRQTFGASSLRYIKTMNTYDPISGSNAVISPARQHMKIFLTRWMKDFHIDGIRMDSVENVANWDFIQEFKNMAHSQFRQRYGLPENTPNTNFIVVGEELTLPLELITQHRLDGLWNEHFRPLIRSALTGRQEGGDDFPTTVKKAIDCRLLGFADGAQAVNYLTSHDVQGVRQERLYNFLAGAIPIAQSRLLFNEALIRDEIFLNDPAIGQADLQRRVEGAMLHKAALRRIKLGFACLLTAVGIPMILAGDEFGDQHDLFDAKGNVTQEGGKQVDPVNFSRAEEPDRKELLAYVSVLIKLRKSHPGLAVNDTEFIHVDMAQGKRVVAWKRGTSDPVVVVANFSDYTTPNALGPQAEYFVHNWPHTPAGMQWFEATQKRNVITGRHNREPIFAWEAKVYHLIPV